MKLFTTIYGVYVYLSLGLVSVWMVFVILSDLAKLEGLSINWLENPFDSKYATYPNGIIAAAMMCPVANAFFIPALYFTFHKGHLFGWRYAVSVLSMILFGSGWLAWAHEHQLG